MILDSKIPFFVFGKFTIVFMLSNLYYKNLCKVNKIMLYFLHYEYK